MPGAVAGPLRTFFSLVLLAGLVSCGGGGGGDSSNTPANDGPTANAGPDQSVAAGATVSLSGSGTDTDGTIASYAWTQTAGVAVTLSSATAAAPTFTAPIGSGASNLQFRLTVTDNRGTASAADTVVIAVGAGVAVNGKVTFARVPFAALNGTGLNYLGTTQQPARQITVEAVDATTQASVSSTTTDGNGDYTILVPGSKNLQIRAKAEMVRAAPQSLPHWQFQVRDVDGSTTPFTYAGATFNSGAGGSTQDVDIPSGWSATGSVNGTRSSAPFAILDTVYKARDFILAVSPTADFPQLTLDWSTTNLGTATFYDDDADGTPAGVNRKIQLAGEAGVDTDEFDEHVIAHEFGHYIEDSFSRSDNIGDAHAPGDRLDPRVAFGEGFGYAFSAMVMNDSIPRDSFGPNQASDSFFDVEDDSNFMVSGTSTEGWYSEASMQEILWDLFDSDADGETVALGFGPIWSVLTGAQRTTNAVTSIFPFITALKTANPSDASGIDAIVTAEAIDIPTTEFATNETNQAGVATTTDVLPLYTPISIGGGPVTVRSIKTFGTPNKVSNQRFLLLDVPSQTNVRFTASAPNGSGRDVDLYVLRQGTTVAFGEVVGDENFTATLPAGQYVLDTYDCDNAGCTDGTPVPADTDITVTVTTN